MDLVFVEKLNLATCKQYTTAETITKLCSANVRLILMKSVNETRGQIIKMLLSLLILQKPYLHWPKRTLAFFEAGSDIKIFDENIKMFQEIIAKAGENVNIFSYKFNLYLAKDLI